MKIIGFSRPLPETRDMVDAMTRRSKRFLITNTGLQNSATSTPLLPEETLRPRSPPPFRHVPTLDTIPHMATTLAGLSLPPQPPRTGR